MRRWEQSYTVYSKGGWSFEGEDSYYTVQNDAGIVMKGEHPYVLTVLSDAYEHLDLLDGLVKEIDQGTYGTSEKPVIRRIFG